MKLSSVFSRRIVIATLALFTTGTALYCSEPKYPLVYHKLTNNPFSATQDVDLSLKIYHDTYNEIQMLKKDISLDVKAQCKKLLEAQYDAQLNKKLFFFRQGENERTPFVARDLLQKYKKTLTLIQEYKKTLPLINSLIQQKKEKKLSLPNQYTQLNTIEDTLVTLEDDYKKIATQSDDYYKEVCSTLPLQGKIKQTRDITISQYDDATQKSHLFVNHFMNSSYENIARAMSAEPTFKKELTSLPSQAKPEKKAVQILKKNFKELITSMQMIGQLARATLNRLEQQISDKDREAMLKKLLSSSSYYMSDEELAKAFGDKPDTDYTHTNLGIIHRYAQKLDDEYAKIYMTIRRKTMPDVFAALEALKSSGIQ